MEPRLAGLMDGSVSTLAPILATRDKRKTSLVRFAGSADVGISLGRAKTASDDGELSGRGSPRKRGLGASVMTTESGLGQALPYLIPYFWNATLTAFALMFLELWAIVCIRNRLMDTPFLRATFQVVLGGALVFAAGALIGSGRARGNYASGVPSGRPAAPRHRKMLRYGRKSGLAKPRRSKG